MSIFKDIKRRLNLSSTLPAGNDGGGAWMMGSAKGGHVHKEDGSCCGHDHHDHHHSHKHDHGHHHHHHGEGCCGHDHDDEEDTTNPRGGCC